VPIEASAKGLRQRLNFAQRLMCGFACKTTFSNDVAPVEIVHAAGTNIVLPGFLFWVALLTLITHLIGGTILDLVCSAKPAFLGTAVTFAGCARRLGEDACRDCELAFGSYPLMLFGNAFDAVTRIVGIVVRRGNEITNLIRARPLLETFR
jgi:hypothetical protein